MSPVTIVAFISMLLIGAMSARKGCTVLVLLAYAVGVVMGGVE